MSSKAAYYKDSPSRVKARDALKARAAWRLFEEHRGPGSQWAALTTQERRRHLVEQRILDAENGIAPAPVTARAALSELDARNRAIKEQRREALRAQYAELDREWETLKDEAEALVYQIYGWTHEDRPYETKVGICAISADRYGGTRTDDRHFNPVEHFCIEVGTLEEAKAIETAFKTKYAPQRLPHVRTGNPSEFFAMHGEHAKNAVFKIMREHGHM